MYDAVGPGTQVDIKGWQATNAQPDSVCSERRCRRTTPGPRPRRRNRPPPEAG
ncbi:hypothetical protein ACFYMX_25915 [Streptomyces griseofuscus]|uniref:hypothetical protein n=1 Tax=Streptomyces griseofuscus TaxID=146922 RepID=UPI0036AEBC04